MDTYIGIDPGWKNLGLAIVAKNESGDLVLCRTETMNPSSYPNVTSFITALHKVIDSEVMTRHLCGVTIERFVPYGSTHTMESEDICMIIGGLRYYFGNPNTWDVEPRLVRAIEWKTSLVKQLFKQKGFDNPSASLDKKFSIAASHACLDEPFEIKNDHEADAICLASLPVFISKGT
jgi:hypothetical protein